MSAAQPIPAAGTVAGRWWWHWLHVDPGKRDRMGIGVIAKRDRRLLAQEKEAQS